MASAAKEADVNGEVGQPDFERAMKIYKGDIKPAQGKVGEFSQELSTAYKSIKKDCNIQPGAMKLYVKLDGMEESKRDDFLRSLNGLMKAGGIFMPRDMLDAAAGAEAGESVIPTAEKPKPKLHTVD
ncbi:hypothetical protein [Parasphingorhabdus sp.]|uniref:hypothetical protein n=1 Tax=Parasphingorhabdus sp. TaxID=2709688 RepID=UPI003A91F816